MKSKYNYYFVCVFVSFLLTPRVYKCDDDDEMYSACSNAMNK